MIRGSLGRIKDRATAKDPKVFIYAPTEVARDTSFPFDWLNGEKVLVRIEDKNHQARNCTLSKSIRGADRTVISAGTRSRTNLLSSLGP